MRNNRYLLWLFSLYGQLLFAQTPASTSYLVLDSLITVAYEAGNFKEAVRYTQIARAKAATNQDSIFARYTNELAVYYYYAGEYDKAEPFYIESKDLWLKIEGAQGSNFAQGLNDLATLYYLLGDFERAEPLFLQAKDIYAKLWGDKDSKFGTVIHNLGSLYSDMGDFEKAEQFYLQAKEIRAKALGEERVLLAHTLNNLAMLYMQKGYYDKTEQFYLEAKKIWAQELSEQHPDFAKSLNNLAGLYITTQQYEKAEQLLLQAQQIRTQALGTLHPSVANGWNNLSMLYQKSGKLDTALHYSQLAIGALSTDTLSNFTDWANLDKLNFISTDYLNRIINNLLAVFDSLYQKNNDKKYLESYYTITQAAMRINQRISNDFIGQNDKIRAISQSNVFMLSGIKKGLLLTKQPEALFNFAESTKAVLLLQAVLSQQNYTFGELPDSLAAQERLLQTKQSELRAKLSGKRTEAEKSTLIAELNTLQQQIDGFNELLKKQYPKYITLKYEQKNNSVADIQSVLDDKTALLEYVVGATDLYLFYLDKHQIIIEAFPISLDTLKHKVALLHNSLSNYKDIQTNSSKAFNDFTQISFWFYRNLLEAILNKVPDIEHLIIIPDADISYIPFEVFLVEPPQDGLPSYSSLHYLIKDYKISYNYSATLWRQNLEMQHGKNNGQFLGIAADYSTYDSSALKVRTLTEQRLRTLLNPLPSAQEEVKGLSKKLEGYFAFGAEANERFFKTNAPQYGIIHLAMHGLLDRKNPILSSLAFTENGDSSENNFLQAYEISKMELNADLVVLSACETGYGKFEQGNGTASLARAFMYAGVPALVVSLWEVNDASTAQIMQFFYDNLANGQDKAEALRQAKLQYLSKAKGMGAHPAYWSAFVQMGDSRPVTLSTKGNSYLKWIVMGAGVLVLGAGLLLRRRSSK